jgi:hypothetical protein
VSASWTRNPPDEDVPTGFHDLRGSNSPTIRSPEVTILMKEILRKTRIPWKETLGSGANLIRGIPGKP